MLHIAMLSAAAFSFAAAPSVGTQDNNLRDDLMRQEVRIIEAFKNHDFEALDGMLSQQRFSLTPERGWQDKSQVLDWARHVKMTSYDIADVKLYQAGDDIAVLTYRFAWSGTQHGEDVHRTCYATVTWGMHDGQWKPLFYQETPTAK